MASTTVSEPENPETSVNTSDQQQSRKLFIGGLNYTTTDEKLNEYFSTYGEITESIIMKDREGRSRGFAFVSFQDRSQLDKFMADRPHIIDGRQIEAKRAMPREEISKPDGQLTVKKIYVSGINEDLTAEHLRNYFQTFGQVVECNIMKDKEDKIRGFAFVTFDDYDSVDRCILEKPHRINDKEVEVRKAIPRDQTVRSTANLSRYNVNKEFNEPTSVFIPPSPLFSPLAYLPAANFFSKPMPLMGSPNPPTAGAILPPSTFYFSPELVQHHFYSQQPFATPNSPLPQNSANFSSRKKFLNEQNSLNQDFSNLNLSNGTRTKSRSNSTTNSEQHRKLFIGGLSFKTTDESLKEYVNKFGEVSDSLVMKDQNGQSRCFGFVTFVDPKAVDEFMKQRPHTLDGRQIDPKRAMPREEANTDDFHLTVKKIFIGGIRQGLNEQMLRDYFSQYGNVNECLFMHDKDGKTRGFAFVEFDDFDSVDKVILARPHTIGDYRVDVKKAVPKDQRQMQLHHQQQQLALQMQAAATVCQFYYSNPVYNSLNTASCTPPFNSQQQQSIRSNGNVDTSNDHVCPQFSTSNNSNTTYHMTPSLRSVSTSNNRRQSSRGSQ